MKKLFYLLMASFFGASSYAQNDMLVNPQQGDLAFGIAIFDFEFAYDGTDLCLVTGSGTTSKLYAIDYNHSTSENVHDWESGEVVYDILSRIATIVPYTGEQLQILDMKVNPKTKSVVLHIINDEDYKVFLAEVKNPSDISIVDLFDVSYSSMEYPTTADRLMDMEWGTDGKMYFCTGDYTLDSDVGYIAAPFEDGAVADVVKTSVFKSNWGGGYFTNAPLERLSFTTINGVDRLVGVTTCAPGFSIPVSSLADTGTLLEVQEDFNVLQNTSMKVVTLTQPYEGGETTYLFDLHDNATGIHNNQLIRIGEKYLDGSRPVSEINNTSELIRNLGGEINPNLDPEEAYEVGTGFKMIAKYSETQLMVVDQSDVLRLLDVTSESLGIEDEMESNVLDFFYKDGQLLFENDFSKKAFQYELTNVEGKVVSSGALNSSRIDLPNLSSGVYVFSLTNGTQLVETKKILIP